MLSGSIAEKNDGFASARKMCGDATTAWDAIINAESLDVSGVRLVMGQDYTLSNEIADLHIRFPYEICRFVFSEVAKPSSGKLSVRTVCWMFLCPRYCWIARVSWPSLAIVGQLVRCVTEHVRMDWKLKPSLLASSGNHLAGRRVG